MFAVIQIFPNIASIDTKEEGLMITEIGAILTIDETKILKDFIESVLGSAGSLTRTGEMIDKMKSDGVWDIYEALKDTANRREG